MSEIKEGTIISYGLRQRKTGAWVRIRSKQNPRGSYACCETSHYAHIARHSSNLTSSESDIWLLPSKDAVLDCLTKGTEYYNADSVENPVIQFDFEDDDLEIVEVTQTVSIKAA